MDRDSQYGAIVKRVLEEVAAMTPSTDTVRTELVSDVARGHYHLGRVGWENKHRVNDIFLHIDVYDGKVWLEHNGTDLLIADDLMAAGIPREHIVLAFHAPEMRKYTDFAVA